MVFPFLCSSSVVRGQTRTSIVRFRESRGVQYPHLYRGGVEHDADHGTEGLGGEVVLELCADDAGVACWWCLVSDAAHLLASVCNP